MIAQQTIEEPTTLLCTHCKKEKPLDAFHRHHALPYGRRRQCKECRNKEASRKNEKERKAVERWALLRFAKDIRKGKAIPCSAKELFNLMVDYFGGPSRIAAAIAAEYEASPPGSRTRASVLKTLLVLEARATAEEAAAAGRFNDEVRAMSDEELEQAVQAAIKRSLR